MITKWDIHDGILYIYIYIYMIFTGGSESDLSLKRADLAADDARRPRGQRRVVARQRGGNEEIPVRRREALRRGVARQEALSAWERLVGKPRRTRRRRSLLAPRRRIVALRRRFAVCVGARGAAGEGGEIVVALARGRQRRGLVRARGGSAHQRGIAAGVLHPTRAAPTG
jgi:hypothetical protein